jgi:L-fuconolactonase
MPSFPIVDSHLHIWDPGRFRYPWLDATPLLNRPYTVEDYRTAIQPYAVEAMVFLQCECEPAQALAEAQWVAREAMLEPRIAGIVAWAPLEKGDGAEADLEALARVPLMRGVRRIIQFEPDLDFCLRPDFIAGVRRLKQFGLSFDICIDHRQMANTVAFARQVPDVPMILDHIGKPDIKGHVLEPWCTHLRELAALPHVVCKVSGMVTEADHAGWTPDDLRPFLDAVIDEFGFDRLIYGGDWPVVRVAAEYPRWVQSLDGLLAGVGESDLRKLYRDNARRFYRLAM